MFCAAECVMNVLAPSKHRVNKRIANRKLFYISDCSFLERT